MITMSEVIITQKLTSKKYVSSICCLSFIILVFYIGLGVFPNVIEPGIVAALASTLFILILGGVSIFFLFYLLWRYRGTGKVRTFSISDELIKIMVPKKHNFQINWSNFDTIQMYKHISRSQLANYKIYKINFLLNNNIIQDVDIELSVDFSKGKCKQIRSLLNQYAVRMNKEYFWGKRRKKK